MPFVPFFLPAPAKLNLHLRVGPPREDGFHPLVSWFRTIGLADTLQVGPNEGDELVLTCDEPTVPTDDSNLVCRAWWAYDTACGDGPTPAQVLLSKRIPAGGGLGGGSSDAAAALVAVERVRGAMGRRVLDAEARAGVAAGVGSDVPFFLAVQRGVTDALCTGRGEVVEPFAPRRRHAVLLILPGLHVSTPAAYRAFDALPPPSIEPTNLRTLSDWSALPAFELLDRLINDLEPATFSLEPRLATLQATCQTRLGRTVRMTGSGSTLFSLFDSADEALAAAEALTPLVRTLPLWDEPKVG